VIQDGDVTLAESGACIQYILTKYGNGRLTVSPDAPNYADFLYWYNWASASFSLRVSTQMLIGWSGLDSENFVVQFSKSRLQAALKMLDDQLEKHTWLAGEEFTVADIAPVFSLTTGRLFTPYSLEGYPNILRWLKKISERDGYKKSFEKGDPGLEPIIGADPPEPLQRA
jgi:glutathione S-transferase